MHHVLVTQIRTSTNKMEVLLSGDARSELRRLGEGLDARQPVRVKDGGIVILDPDSGSTAVQEKQDEQWQGAGRPAARSRQGSASRQGPTGGSRPSRPKPRVVGLTGNYAAQLEDVQRAYPDASVLPDENGIWLLARSRLLSGLAGEAIFLVALPGIPDVEPRGWAFWDQAGQLDWIGPRHTNMGDGSICAYHPEFDKAWAPGGDLRTLLDLYSVWALRHLHLAVFGRWAGRQYAMPDQAGRCDPYYRLVQFEPDELCSCGLDMKYGNCCRPRDLQLPLLAIRRAFEIRNCGQNILDREPPQGIIDAVTKAPIAPPAIVSIHAPLRAHQAAQQSKCRRPSAKYALSSGGL